MKLEELIQNLQGMTLSGTANPEIAGLALDSRKVKDGFLFAAIPGTLADGHDYIGKAIQAGARAILCQRMPEKIDNSISYLQVDNVRDALGSICAKYYNHPDKDLIIIGITGTNGKTSIATWLYELGTKLGYPCGLISTIKIKIKDKEYSASHTTPDAISLYQNLYKMVHTGCQYVFMEVSSHALDQKRVAGISFSGAVFTNLSRDHLDYHVDYPSYLHAKKMLFDQLDKKSFALINREDRNAEVMIQNTEAKVSGFSTRSLADYQGKLMEQIGQAMLLEINGKELWLPFIGRFNASNLTAVFGVAMELNWDEDEVLAAMSAMDQVEGRFERIDLGNNVTGIVDYAHTPDALENVLGTIKDMCVKGQRIITVIGAGGDRDKGKRPKMASEAVKSSDIVILTSDNPRSEDPESIIEDMKTGIPEAKDHQVFCLTNRREAIKLAVAMSTPGDFILIAGKGHEKYQEIKGERHHFDDKEELLKIKFKAVKGR